MEGGVIDKKTGRDVGLVGAGVVEVGMGVLAVIAHLQMIVTREIQEASASNLDKIQAHETQ